jgi:hypothetical protein
VGWEPSVVALGEGLEGVVRFRSAVDDACEVPLGEARATDLCAAEPWRSFRWRRGQQHFSGFWWSSTMGGHVTYESRLELGRLILADFDPAVRVIVSQPFLLEAPVGGRTRRHVPDFLLLRGDELVVVNVKPRERLAKAHVRATLDWANELLEGRGWRTEVWSGTDPDLLANVRFLAGFRRSELFEADLLADAAQVAPGRTVAETESVLVGRWPPLSVRPAVLHLLWSGRLRTDIVRPLDADSTLEAAA